MRNRKAINFARTLPQREIAGEKFMFFFSLGLAGLKYSNIQEEMHK